MGTEVYIIAFFVALILPWLFEFFRSNKGTVDVCDRCDGEGYLPKKDSTDNLPCEKCKGTGFLIK